MTKDKKIKYFSTVCASIMTGLFATSAIAQVPKHMTSNKNVQSKKADMLSHAGYEVGIANNLNGVQMLLSWSSFDPTSQCSSDCWKNLGPGEGQQWVNVGADSGAWAAIGYHLCKSVTYNAEGKATCAGWFGDVTVNLNHTANTLKAGDDATSQSFFAQHNIQLKNISGNLFSITSNYVPPSVPPLPDPQTYTSGLKYRGVNLAGAEFGTNVAGARAPTVDDASWAAQHGVNTFRIPIRAEYAMSNNINGQINTAYIDNVKSTMTPLLEKGYSVILDLHNYMRFCPEAHPDGCNTVLTGPQLQSIWGSLLLPNAFGDLAKKYPNHLILDLMNEPFGINAVTLVADYNQTIAHIREGGFPNLLLVEGTEWTGLHSWESSGNAEAFKNITDTGSNTAINVHQYFDGDHSGAASTCVASNTLMGNINANSFVTWLKDNKKKAFVTEFGAPNNAMCQSDMSTFLSYLQQNSYNASEEYGFIGWTLWSAGHAWADDYKMNFQGPSGVNYPLWESLFVAKNFISPTTGS